MIDHIKKADKDLDSVLAKQPVFLKLERQTGLKKTHLVYTVVAALSFVLLYQVATEPVVALALFAYPLFLSLEAVESHDKAKDAHILSYWSVLAALQLLEVLVPFLFQYIPFYQLAKIVLAAWMYLPQTKVCDLCRIIWC